MLAPSWEHCRQLHHLIDTWMALLPDIKKIFSSNNSGWSHNRALGMDSLTDLPKNGSNTVIPTGRKRVEATYLSAHLVPRGFGNCVTTSCKSWGLPSWKGLDFYFGGFFFFHIFSNGRVATFQNTLEVRPYIFTSHNFKYSKTRAATCNSSGTLLKPDLRGWQALTGTAGGEVAEWPSTGHVTQFCIPSQSLPSPVRLRQVITTCLCLSLFICKLGLIIPLWHFVRIYLIYVSDLEQICILPAKRFNSAWYITSQIICVWVKNQRSEKPFRLEAMWPHCRHDNTAWVTKEPEKLISGQPEAVNRNQEGWVSRAGNFRLPQQEGSHRAPLIWGCRFQRRSATPSPPPQGTDRLWSFWWKHHDRPSQGWQEDGLLTQDPQGSWNVFLWAASQTFPQESPDMWPPRTSLESPNL